MTEQTLSKRRPSRRLWLGVVALVMVVALVAIGVAVRNSLRSGVRAGTQIQVDDDLSFGGPGTRTGSVLLPTGALKVQVTRPATHFSPDARPYDDSLDADRVEKGGRWVGVGWTLDPLQLPQPQLLLLGRTPAQFQVALVADGTRYDLGAGLTEDADAASESRAGLAIAGRKLTLVDHKRVYVALPTAPKAMSVEVAYDGLTQRFDAVNRQVTRGVADPLYRTGGKGPSVDPGSDDSGITLAAPGFGFLRDSKNHQVTYSVRPVTALPYVPGLGWAKPGRTWLAVPILTNIVDPFVFWPTPEAAAHALYRLQLRSTAVTLDGARARRELPYYQQNAAATDSESNVYYIWDVADAAAKHPLTLHQVYVSGPPDDESPATAPRRATATADVELTVTR